ncbi:MAG TPA: GNAT family N-acetyltransferase [Acetivibrio clariflavus]|nr:GNAT family N-acetyltransferase [Acetivibrio clariflavus]
MALEIRKLEKNEIPEALSVVWEVFCQFEAPEYLQEGIDEFKRTIENYEFISSMNFYGAIENGQIIGVLAIRPPQHISFFFVKTEYHGRGIGRKLFNTMRQDYEIQKFTVNSSPYAVEIYRHLGFMPTDTEKITNGIRYTPMVFRE